LEIIREDQIVFPERTPDFQRSHLLRMCQPRPRSVRRRRRHADSGEDAPTAASSASTASPEDQAADTTLLAQNNYSWPRLPNLWPRPAPAPAPAPAPSTAALPAEKTCGIANFQQELLKLVNQARASSRYCGNTSYASAAPQRWNSKLFDAAAGQTTLQQVMDGWLANPGHCANIMNNTCTEIGVSCVKNAASTYKQYWTMELAAPR
jgi:Cysteine-rich secretory protein family